MTRFCHYLPNFDHDHVSVKNLQLPCCDESNEGVNPISQKWASISRFVNVSVCSELRFTAEMDSLGDSDYEDAQHKEERDAEESRHNLYASINYAHLAKTILDGEVNLRQLNGILKNSTEPLSFYLIHPLDSLLHYTLYLSMSALKFLVSRTSAYAFTFSLTLSVLEIEGYRDSLSNLSTESLSLTGKLSLSCARLTLQITTLLSPAFDELSRQTKFCVPRCFSLIDTEEVVTAFPTYFNFPGSYLKFVRCATLEIRNVNLSLIIGVLPAEQIAPQHVIVDIDAWIAPIDHTVPCPGNLSILALTYKCCEPFLTAPASLLTPFIEYLVNSHKPPFRTLESLGTFISDWCLGKLTIPKLSPNSIFSSSASVDLPGSLQRHVNVRLSKPGALVPYANNCHIDIHRHTR